MRHDPGFVAKLIVFAPNMIGMVMSALVIAGATAPGVPSFMRFSMNLIGFSLGVVTGATTYNKATKIHDHGWKRFLPAPKRCRRCIALMNENEELRSALLGADLDAPRPQRRVTSVRDL